MAAAWRDGQQRDIYREMLHLATRVACKALFDTELSRDELDLVDAMSTEALDQIQRTMTSVEALIPQAVPTPGNVRLRKAVRRLDEIVYGISETDGQTGARGETCCRRWCRRETITGLCQANDLSSQD